MTWQERMKFVRNSQLHSAVGGGPAVTRKVAAPSTDYAAMEKRAEMEAKAGAAPMCIGCGQEIL